MYVFVYVLKFIYLGIILSSNLLKIDQGSLY